MPKDGYTQCVKPTLAELEAILNSEDPSPYAVLGGGKVTVTEQEMEMALCCPLPHRSTGECVEVLRLKEMRARPGYWIDVAASGRTQVLTRKGQPMAMLVPIPPGTYIVR